MGGGEKEEREKDWRGGRNIQRDLEKDRQTDIHGDIPQTLP